jgi:hypothetical protein
MVEDIRRSQSRKLMTKPHPRMKSLLNTQLCQLRCKNTGRMTEVKRKKQTKEQ